MTTCTARFGGASCGLASGRRKRSTSDRTSNSVLLVSVSNNGQNFSSSVPIVMYDSSCTVCETNDTSINCQLRVGLTIHCHGDAFNNFLIFILFYFFFICFFLMRYDLVSLNVLKLDKVHRITKSTVEF